MLPKPPPKASVDPRAPPNGSLDPKLGAALEVGAVLAAGLKAAAKSIVLLGACALGSPIPAKRFGFYSAAG